MRLHSIQKSTLLALLAGMLFVLGTPRAQAQKTASKWRSYHFSPQAGIGVPETSAERMGIYVRTLLSIDDRFEFVERIEMEGLAKKAPDQPKMLVRLPKDKKIEKANRLVWRGREFRHKNNLPKSARLLKQAIAIYSKRFMHMEDFSTMTEALYEASLTFYRSKAMSDTAYILTRLFILKPDWIFDRRQVDSDFMELAETIRARTQKKKGGQMIIRSRPKGATVYVDGVDKGPAPLTLNIPAAGPHFVVVKLDDYYPAGQLVRMPRAGRKKHVNIRLRAIRKAKEKKPRRLIPEKEIEVLLAKGRFGTRAFNSLKAFARQGNADVLIITHVGSTGEHLIYTPFVYSVKYNRLVRVRPVKIELSLANMQVELLPIPDRIATAVKRIRARPAIVGQPRAWRRKPKYRPKPKVIPLPPPVIVVPTPPPTPVAPVLVAKGPPKPVPTPTTFKTPGRTSAGLGSSLFASGSILRKWWFWTAAAVVVGGTITTVLVTSGGGDTFKANVQW